MRFTTIVTIASVTALLYTGWGSTAVQGWLDTRGLPTSSRYVAPGEAPAAARAPRESSGAWRARFHKLADKLGRFDACREAMPDDCRGEVPSECRELLFKPDGLRVHFVWDQAWPESCTRLEDALLDSETAWRDERDRLEFDATRAGVPEEWRH